MQTFLNIFAPIAFTIFLIGMTVRVGRWFSAVITPRRIRGRTPTFMHAPPTMNAFAAVKAVLVEPITHFHGKANRTWSRGYAFYHMAIITEVTGYSIAALILFANILLGRQIPDVAQHVEASYNYSPSNLLAIIFGNGEHLQAQFLFGNFAGVFIAVTWVAVACAVIGNLHLLYTLLRGRNGAVVDDIDPAAQGIRLKGRITWDRVVVRLLIFTIIWTELFARLHLAPNIVFFHAALGLLLFTLLPFTYIFHMIYNFIALFYSARRRMIRTVA